MFALSFVIPQPQVAGVDTHYCRGQDLPSTPPFLPTFPAPNYSFTRVFSIILMQVMIKT